MKFWTNDATDAVKLDPKGAVKPAPGWTLRETTPEDDAVIGARTGQLKWDSSAQKLARDLISPSLTDALKQILNGLQGDNARRRGLELAADLKAAQEHGKPSDVPMLLRTFDPGADPELVAAKAAALALLPS